MTEPRLSDRRSPWATVRGWVRSWKQEPGSENLLRLKRSAESCYARMIELETATSAELQNVVDEVLRNPPSPEESTGFFAVAGELARRRLGLRPFNVQLLAAMNMFRGRVVDMATGEGKTLVGFLVAAAYATMGRRVHVLSANDYLAERDAEFGSAFFESLGLSVSAVTQSMPRRSRRDSFKAEVVYTTVHQVGFDLLRDRQRTQNPDTIVDAMDVAIVDEIDAVLIDDAMVPLVIAGEADSQPPDAELVDAVRALRPNVDYVVDADGLAASFTEEGVESLEAALGGLNLYDDDSNDLLTAAHLALHAHALVHRDIDYVVSNDRIELINTTRGRVADRQRWPDGLQAAVEQKERLPVSQQARVLDQMLVETVVREYTALTGMSGTAAEAAERIQEDLELRTGVIPRNRPLRRTDLPDRLFLTRAQRNEAAALHVAEARSRSRPVLVGTGSVRESEEFASVLADHGISAAVLNAKNDAEEAEIIARSGTAGTVTVSTQMAGRGVDIMLDEEASRAGGLLVLGLARYDSTRLDHQLRGRAGRQSDPGESVFYTSLEDPVVTENLEIGVTPDSVSGTGLIEDAWFQEVYEHAQRVAEGKALQLHRTTRSYHTVTDRHRVLTLRLREQILSDSPGSLDGLLDSIFPDASAARQRWKQPEKRELVRQVVLFHIDQGWADHLEHLAGVREGIHLRVLGRQNPLDEFLIIANESLAHLESDYLARCAETLCRAHDEARAIEDLGLRRPSSTWTYMVTDNPFGSEADRVVEFIGRLVRGKRPRAVRYV